MDRIGLAVIGCGYWGSNYIRVFTELPNSQVQVACDRRPEQLRAVRERCPDLATISDYREALALSSVQAVVISTPASTHYQIARDCLLAGRDVLIEKPMTANAEQAQELVELAERKGLTLMVGHTFLYNDAVLKLRELVREARLGRIYYLYSRRTNLGPFRDDVNAIWDLAPHDVSIFGFLLDQTPQWASATGVHALNHGCCDAAFVTLGYGDGVLAHVHVSWADPHKVRELVVVGSERSAIFDDISVEARLKIFERGVRALSPTEVGFGEHQLLVHGGDIIIPRLNASEPLKNLGRHFIECVVQRKRPLSDGRNGLEVVRIMEAIDHSLQCKGSPVPIA